VFGSHVSLQRMATRAGGREASKLVAWLWAVGLLSLAWRLWIAASLPLTGDEAQFYWWSRFPDYGYYDHPPMVAWWIGLVRALLGDAAWAVRLPAVLLPLGVGWALWWGWSPLSRQRAAWAVLLYWLAPVNWLNAMIVTDTPLIFWAAWSVAALARAERAADQRARAGQGGHAGLLACALSGLFLGAAFLSKYFAVLLGLAYAVYFLAFARRRAWRLLWLAAFALPGVAVNVVWNLNHCWTNIMFNLFNRNEGAHRDWHLLAGYVLMMVYLVSPVLLMWLWRWRQVWRVQGRAQALAACALGVPLLCFGLMSLDKQIGLHWVMGFLPFLFVLVAWALPLGEAPGEAGRLARGLGAWLALHLVLCVVLAALPLKTWQHWKYYHRLVEAARSQEMVRQARVPGAVLMSNAYSSASIFGYAAGEHVPVFGLGGVHARQDDLIVDTARYDGQHIRIVTTREPSLADYRPYFDRVALLRFEQDGAPFYVVDGQHFRYAAYREGVLAEINRRYYRFPDWLPVWRCPFCERYCGAARCPP